MIKIISRIPWVAAVAVIAVSLSTPASAFLNFFEEDLENAPDNAQLQAQEAQANKLVLEAQAFERDGRTEKALGAYKKVVDIYPLTTNAALSQYKTGTIYQKLGKFKKAFDAFQKFVENYKSSAAFNSAIQSQYEITRMGQEGTFKDSFLGIPVKLQPSELTDMYGKIIKNAPYSEFAPLSQFAIAEVLEEADKPYEATAAYQLVVKNYPRSKQAPEAQLRIGRIGEDSLQRGSQDAGNLAQTREALEDVLIQFPDSNQAAVARERLGSLSERETKKQFDVAEFYEKQGRHRAALIYYGRVASSGSGEYAAKAQDKLENLTPNGPGDIKSDLKDQAIWEGDPDKGLKMPSMPKIAFWKSDEVEGGDAGPSPQYYPEGADADLNASEWAEFERQIAEGGDIGSIDGPDPAPGMEGEEDGGFFRMPSLSLRPWKEKDAEGGPAVVAETSEEVSASVPEVIDVPEESDGGFASKLAFWKGDEAAPTVPPAVEQQAAAMPEPRVAQNPEAIPPAPIEEPSSGRRFRMPNPFGSRGSDPAEPVLITEATAEVPEVSNASNGRRFRLNPFGGREEEAAAIPPAVANQSRPVVETAPPVRSSVPAPSEPVVVEAASAPSNEGRRFSIPKPKVPKLGLFGKRGDKEDSAANLPPALANQTNPAPSPTPSVAPRSSSTAQPRTAAPLQRPVPSRVVAANTTTNASAVPQKKRANYAGPPVPRNAGPEKKEMRAIAPLVPIGGNTPDPVPTRVLPPSAEDLPLPPAPEE